MNVINRIFQPLDLFFENIKLLRGLTLSLAMQGKLVPQDPNDQPASEFLKEIEREKQKLLKEGKIKKIEKLPEIKPEEIPYELPQGWVWVKLGNLVSIQTGKKDVNEGHMEGEYPFFSCAAEPLKSNEYSFDCEALLLPGNGANVGKVTYYKGKFEAYQRTYVLNNFCKVRIEYVEKSLNARFSKSIEGKQYGSAINYIKIGNLLEFIFPLPPLAEQKRIVAKVDELMALCDTLDAQKIALHEKRQKAHKAALNSLVNAEDAAAFNNAWKFLAKHFGVFYSVKENVAELRKTILQLAVMGKLEKQDLTDQPAAELLKEIESEKKKLLKKGKIKKIESFPAITEDEISYKLPKGWEWVRLSEITLMINTGPFGSSLHKSDYVKNGIPVINPACIRNGCIIPSDKMMISEKTYKRLSSYGLETDDIVMARRGEMGRCAVVTNNEKGWLCGTGSLVIRIYYKLYKPYFQLLLSSDYTVSYLNEQSVGTTMSNLNQKILERHIIPLPPLAEQKCIVAKVDSLMAICDELEKGLDALENQRGRISRAALKAVEPAV